MTLPELMSKIWDGDEAEYFTHIDMMRCEYNANICAREAGLSEVTFQEVTRASQFDYTEAQKLEDLIRVTAVKLGLSVSYEASWSYNRLLSYADFERWEANTWAIYTAMGGTGERIPAGKILVTYSATLFRSSWRGSGPYYIDLDMPAMYKGTEALAYVPHTATVEERMAEYNASLRVVYTSDRHVRVWALQSIPGTDIPIRVSLEGLPLHQEITLTAAGWTGEGPWTQTVTLSSAPVNAVIGPWDGMTDAAVLAMADAIISVSAVSGTSVTVRAVGEKPMISLNPVIMWETSESD